MEKQQQASTFKLAFVTLICLFLWRLSLNLGLSIYISWLFQGLFLLGVVKSSWSLFQDFRWWRLMRHMTTPLGLEGNTHTPTIDDLINAGLKTENLDGQGLPLGAMNGRMLYTDTPGHISVRAATNAGKTESFSAPACFALGKDRNLVITSKGPDLVFLCAKHRRDLGQEVIIIDPWNLSKGSGFPTHDFNPIGHFVRLAQKNNPDLIDKATKAVQIQVTEPARGAGDNDFFLKAARGLLAPCEVFAAINEAETGELSCNLPYMRTVLCGGEKVLRKYLLDMALCETFDGYVSRAAQKFLDLLDSSPKTAQSILAEISNGLQLYEPGSTLGKRTQYSDFDPAIIKQKPVTIFIVTAPEKSSSHGSYAGACIDVLTDASIEADSFFPRVTFLLDEFPNLSPGPIPSIAPTKFIGRSRGTQLITIVQDTASYEARYKQESSMFTTQSDVILAFSIRSTKDAEEYSKRAGQLAAMVPNYSLPNEATLHGEQNYSLGLSEKGIAAMRPDEFLQMPDFTAALFFKQQPVQVLNMVSYRNVEPWRSQAGEVPGAPPMQELPVLFNL